MTPRVLLTDIDQAAADIRSFTQGMDNVSFATDERTQAAVECKFEIIGEAVNRLHAVHPDMARRIPDMLRLIDFRNHLAHGYDSVAPELVWRHIVSDLPELIDAVEGLLEELPESSG
ncbi:MAG: DUF86 domain-containing protein [bacterium]|nr:DUF86 domain-containing protein [bacterium]